MSEDLRRERLKKLEALQAMGVDPFGGRFEKTDMVGALVSDFREGRPARTAGRLTAMRLMGKSVFCDLKDETGRVQLYFQPGKLDGSPEKIYNQLDIGDIVGVEGELFKTKTGEISVRVARLILLAKSLRPLPEKWHGLKDVEARYRQRYLDLASNDQVKEIFRKRSTIVRQIRLGLDDKGYLEVETPMMHPIPGGAAGKPFKTRHEALGMELYLRVAPELYLKRLLVGGFDKVYEINKSFRNEGISTRHNPEFTMLEVYEAYSDCAGMMKLTEDLITSLAQKIFGKTTFEYQGKTVDPSKWERALFADLMKEQFGITPEESPEEWIKKLKKKGVEIEGKELSRTQVINIVGELIEPKAHNHPVFVIDIFKEMCPLAKTKKDKPLLTDRFELYIGGMEIANAYSELNDPMEQQDRFEEDIKGLKDKKDKIDADFIRALEYGMPPAGGLGIGIDRLVMILTNSPSIRDVILFPQLKPENIE